MSVHLGFFIENYVAGGADKVARLIIDNVAADKITLYVNSNNDFSVLESTQFSPRVKLCKYSYPSPATLGEKISKIKSPIFRIFFRLMSAAFRYPLFLIAVLFFCKQFKNQSFTSFISNNGGYPGGDLNRAASIAAFLVGVPHNHNIHIFHNMATKPPLIFYPLEFIIDYFISNTSILVSVSNEAKKSLFANRSVKAKCIVIYNGTPKSKKRHARNASIVNILCVGSLDSRKNQLFLIRALIKFKETHNHPFHLHIVGKEFEVDYERNLRHEVNNSSLYNHVTFHGFSTDTTQFYNEADLLVLTSTVESFPMVILEAASRGIPTIASAAGGIPEQIVHGNTGFVFPINNETLFLKYLDTFFSDPQKREELSQNTYIHFESNFSLESMIEKYNDLLAK